MTYGIPFHIVFHTNAIKKFGDLGHFELERVSEPRKGYPVHGWVIVALIQERSVIPAASRTTIVDGDYP